MTRTFDPVTEVQKLRDHLSSHDKPIAMLFGAGTSCAVQATDGKPLIPAVAALTESCEQSALSLGPPFPDAWTLIRDSLPETRRDIEEILSVDGSPGGRRLQLQLTIDKLNARAVRLRTEIGQIEAAVGMTSSALQQARSEAPVTSAS